MKTSSLTSEECFPCVRERSGVDGLEALRWLHKHPTSAALIKTIITATYQRLLPEPAGAFVHDLSIVLDSLVGSNGVAAIYAQLEPFRVRFRASGLSEYYEHEFRKANLRESMRLCPATHFVGRILDIGADDNLTGAVLERFPGVESITGTDICQRGPVFTSERTQFLLQPLPDRVPVASASYDIALCRYSLHHMVYGTQERMLTEIHRCLKVGGRVIIWENCISTSLPPEQCFSAGTLSRIVGLSPAERHAFLSAMDVISFAIKEKLQPFPFSFRTLEDWMACLSKGWHVISARNIGLPLLDLHQVPLGLILAEKI